MFRALVVPAAAALGFSAALALPVLAQDALPEGAIAHVKYVCDDDKSVEATYFPEKVDLVLSDDRTMTVPQAMSGSGARYANADESFVFWNKGDDAFITEGDPDKPTFANCTDEAKKT